MLGVHQAIKFAPFGRPVYGSVKCPNTMNKFELAKKLYAEGYEHREVRSIWAYAWNEQYVGRAGKKRRPWQLKALEQVGVTIEEIEFEPTDGGDLGSYF